MSTAIAMAPSPAPHDRPTYAAEITPSVNASSVESPSTHRNSTTLPPPVPSPASGTPTGQRSGSTSPRGHTSQPRSSPTSAVAGPPPKIFVKKEPGSPELGATRHRPRRLDLSKNTNASSNTPASARPLTARDGLVIQEVGIACLSPGFVTQDPVMKEQLQRSISVREHQRQIIEQRLQQQSSAKGDGPSGSAVDTPKEFPKTPGMSRRNKAPPGLSIVAPSHEQFAHERVIQSAPLGQTFTGRHHPQPPTRHVANQPSNLSSTSHIHHVPATQTNNRLPPLADVFGMHSHGADREQQQQQQPSGPPQSALFASHQSRGPLTSPGLPPHHQQHPHQPQQHHQHQPQHHGPGPTSAAGRAPREYKSAEEAQAEMAAGRPELLPKLVHYGSAGTPGNQPPTPPSPAPGQPRSSFVHDASRSVPSGGKRRTRNEYEEGTSPPLGNGRASQRRGPFGEGRDTPETQRAKREEFLRICERAWDLFHS